MRISDWSSDVCSSDLPGDPFAQAGILLYGLLIIGLGAMFVRLPTGFLPEEDQGTIIALVQLPAGATAHRTTAVNDQMSEYLRGPEKIGRASCRERCVSQ